MSEVSLTAGGYRYSGDLKDGPGRPRGPLTVRVLKTLAGLGGEASTTEVRRALSESGAVLPVARVNDVLGRLAKASPPAVTAVGDPRGGRGKAQRWRLEHAETGECGGCGHLTGTSIHRIVCGDGEL